MDKKMTIAALAALDAAPSGRKGSGQKREEFDRPEREAELIAEALRRRSESLDHLKRAFATLIGRPN